MQGPCLLFALFVMYSWPQKVTGNGYRPSHFSDPDPLLRVNISLRFFNRTLQLCHDILCMILPRKTGSLVLSKLANPSQQLPRPLTFLQALPITWFENSRQQEQPMLGHALVVLARSLHVLHERLYALWSIAGACHYKTSAIPFPPNSQLQLFGTYWTKETTTAEKHTRFHT